MSLTKDQAQLVQLRAGPDSQTSGTKAIHINSHESLKRWSQVTCEGTRYIKIIFYILENVVVSRNVKAA